MRSQMVRLNNSDEVERCLDHFRQSFVCEAYHPALGSAAIAPASTAQA
jgi:hypothetical protein